MNEIMLRGFANKCAANHINHKVMLKYALNLSGAGAAVRGAGRAAASFAKKMFSPTVTANPNFQWMGKTPKEPLMASGLQRAMSTPAAKAGIPAALAAGGGAVLGSGLSEGMNTIGRDTSQAPPVPAGPPMPSAQQKQDMNPGMLQQLMAAMKSNKGMAAGAGVGAVGAGAAGANYLKGKSKKTDDKSDKKKDKKKEDKSEE